MPSSAKHPDCPLCHTAGSQPFARLPLLEREADYFRCPTCQLTFIAREALPSREEEQAHYALHQNSPDDAGYRAFLARLAEPLIAQLSASAEAGAAEITGLDFGCGPGPTLSKMLTEAGFPTLDFDPLYANDTHLLTQQYDFVTCSEVVEHFHHPAESFGKLRSLLRPSGTLAIMTGWLTDDAGFARWHYRRDPTHVCFYKPATFGYLAQQWGWQLSLPATNIALLRAPA